MFRHEDCTLHSLAKAVTNSKTLLQDILSRMVYPFDPGEKQAIALMLLEKITGLTKTAIISGRPSTLSPSQKAVLDESVARLNKKEPIQYILGEAWFYGRSFFVDRHVLIPRPETELVVEEALHRAPSDAASILDIGTGSGCIAITLAIELPGSGITAVDISEMALEVARRNASLWQVTNVIFVEQDILKDSIDNRYDLILSNPPYVPSSESSSLEAHVLQYEPHEALFVPDHDPLIFYRAIAEYGHDLLNPEGFIIVEIHESFGESAKALFEKYGYQARIICDLDAKDRVIIARPITKN